MRNRVVGAACGLLSIFLSHGAVSGANIPDPFEKTEKIRVGDTLENVIVRHFLEEVRKANPNLEPRKLVIGEDVRFTNTLGKPYLKLKSAYKDFKRQYAEMARERNNLSSDLLTKDSLWRKRNRTLLLLAGLFTVALAGLSVLRELHYIKRVKKLDSSVTEAHLEKDALQTAFHDINALCHKFCIKALRASEDSAIENDWIRTVQEAKIRAQKIKEGGALDKEEDKKRRKGRVVLALRR